MTQYRAGSVILLVLESIRLSLILALASGSLGSSSQAFSPAFAAAQALFVLMALFYALDGSRYAVFRELFQAGKIISALSLVTWLVVSLQKRSAILSVNDVQSIVALVVPALVASYDAISAAVLLWRSRGQQKTGTGGT